MRRYRVEFSSKLIDESRLRDVLEREFELSGIGIVREESADSNKYHRTRHYRETN
jgi:hypothetical protein